MELYYCPTCKGFIAHIDATVTIRGMSLDATAAHIAANEIYVVGDDIYTVPINALADIVCGECEQAIHLQEVDECPHDWSGGFTRQQCRLCGEWRQGRVVFD